MKNYILLILGPIKFTSSSLVGDTCYRSKTRQKTRNSIFFIILAKSRLSQNVFLYKDNIMRPIDGLERFRLLSVYHIAAKKRSELS